MTKTYRIKSRTRFTCFVTLTIILITILANFALGFSTASSLTVPQYEEIRIQSGDTLWDIAGRYTDNSQDIRSAIHEICQINDISASELYAGMTIKVLFISPICHTLPVGPVSGPECRLPDFFVYIIQSQELRSI